MCCTYLLNLLNVLRTTYVLHVPVQPAEILRTTHVLYLPVEPAERPTYNTCVVPTC